MNRSPLFALMVLGLLASTACAPLQGGDEKAALPPTARRSDVVAKSLSEGAAGVEKLLIELSEARQANKVNPDDLGNVSFAVSVEWVGELEPLVKALAASCGMGFRVIGRSPSPVLVSVDVSEMLVLEVFRVLGMQAGTRADIIYRSAENMVEIVYAEK